MSKLGIAIAISMLTVSTLAKADAGLFLGVSYAFGGGGPGISLKVLSSDKEDKAVVGAGVSYYPTSAKAFGADVSVGYNFNNAGVTVGYDFLQNGAAIGIGYVNTEDDHNNSSATTITAPVVPVGPVQL